MILAFLPPLAGGIAAKAILLQAVPIEARAIATNAIDTFGAFASKREGELRRLRAFRTAVARAGGSRYPMPEWDSGDDAYLRDPGLRLRYEIDAVDASRKDGAILVTVRFRRFTDRKDLSGSFGTPGKVLVASESLQDTYVVRPQGRTWSLASFTRATMRNATEAKR